MSTPDLFEYARPEPAPTAPYVPGSDTSKAAAKRAEGFLSEAQQTVFDAIQASGNHGRTCEEVERATKLKHQTASARIVELRDAQRIEKTGERRRNASGCTAAVYRAVGGAR